MSIIVKCGNCGGEVVQYRDGYKCVKCKYFFRTKQDKSTEQYDEVPKLEEQPLAFIESNNNVIYPSCKKHGALICFKENIYRCIECGWAIKYKRD